MPGQRGNTYVLDFNPTDATEPAAQSQLEVQPASGCRTAAGPLQTCWVQSSPDAAVNLSSHSFVCLPARESSLPRLPLRRRRAIVPLPTTRHAHRRTPTASSHGIDFVSPVCERDEHAGTARASLTELLVAESRTFLFSPFFCQRLRSTKDNPGVAAASSFDILPPIKSGDRSARLTAESLRAESQRAVCAGSLHSPFHTMQR